MRKTLRTVLWGVICWAAAQAANAGEIVIPAFEDGQLHSAGVLGVSADTTSTTVQTSKSGNNIHSGAFLFDFSSVPENYSVKSVHFEATLSLPISNTATSAMVEFHGFNSDTTISAIDFNSPVSNLGSFLAEEDFAVDLNINPAGTELSIELDASSMQSRIDSSDTFMLRTETVNFVTFQVHSLENTRGIAPPTLLLNAFSDADFNQDDLLDCTDVDALVGEIVNGTNLNSFDLTGDGNVDSDDLTEWLSQAGAVNLASAGSYSPGDANLDGTVDVSDFNIWNANKFTNTARWCAGDFNADGSIDVGDFNQWNSHKFTVADSTATVPEPTTGILGILALFGMLGFRRA